MWIGEYVLKDYGTGAIMAVPSDDERDKVFAEKFGLTIIPVVDKSNYPGAGIHDKTGIMINSGFINGLEVKEAIQRMLDYIESNGLGRKEINYKLRDANFSRQRYWGEPFPIRYDEEGVACTLDEDVLPLVLPELENFYLPQMAEVLWPELNNGFMKRPDLSGKRIRCRDLQVHRGIFCAIWIQIMKMNLLPDHHWNTGKMWIFT